MSLTLLTPPADTPVPRAMLAEHLRLSQGFAELRDAEDPALDSALRAATAAIERRIDGALLSQGWLWRLSAWPVSGRIELPLSPVIAVTSVTLVNADGASTEWTGFTIDTASRPSRLCARSGGLPRIPPGGSVEIVFTAGYGPAYENIPADLRHAVLLLAAHYYENREATGESVAPLPFGVGGLIAPYRPIRL